MYDAWATSQTCRSRGCSNMRFGIDVNGAPTTSPLYHFNLEGQPTDESTDNAGKDYEPGISHSEAEKGPYDDQAEDQQWGV